MKQDFKDLNGHGEYSGDGSFRSPLEPYSESLPKSHCLHEMIAAYLLILPTKIILSKARANRSFAAGAIADHDHLECPFDDRLLVRLAHSAP